MIVLAFLLYNKLFINFNKLLLIFHFFVYIIKQRGDIMVGDKNLTVEIGKRIYDRRKSLGITQEGLAELADTTPQAISNYERGERELRATTIIKLAQALQTDTDYILTGKVNTGNIDFDISDEKKHILNNIICECMKLIL